MKHTIREIFDLALLETGSPTEAVDIAEHVMALPDDKTAHAASPAVRAEGAEDGPISPAHHPQEDREASDSASADIPTAVPQAAAEPGGAGADQPAPSGSPEIPDIPAFLDRRNAG